MDDDDDNKEEEEEEEEHVVEYHRLILPSPNEGIRGIHRLHLC
jgi:hypothetical protein